LFLLGQLTDKFISLAQKKKCTPVQLGLAWILMQSELIIPIPGSTRPEGVEESLATLKVKLSDDEVKEIRDFVDKADFKGVRYSGQCSFPSVIYFIFTPPKIWNLITSNLSWESSRIDHSHFLS
jgi:hypothetical protein